MKSLNKKIQKNIIGGLEDPNYGICVGKPGELICTTPNGTESWHRNSLPENPTEECRGIYPAYGSNVTGKNKCTTVIVGPVD